MAAPVPSISLDSVTRSWGERVVLDAISGSWTGPGLIGLVGPNGSGKSSLLRIVAQLLEPDSGVVTVCGHDIAGGSSAARLLTGFAPHEPLAYATRTVRQNLEHTGRLAGLRRRDAAVRAAAALGQWGLDVVSDQAVGSLSRGWAQRYSMARADLLAPPVLLLDEPTTGLDDAARDRLERQLATWREDRLVVVSSHERMWLGEHADELLDLAQAAAAALTPADMHVVLP